MSSAGRCVTVRSGGRSPEESLWGDQDGAEALFDPHKAEEHSLLGPGLSLKEVFLLDNGLLKAE